MQIDGTRCITKDCLRPRVQGTWYCKECTDSYFKGRDMSHKVRSYSQSDLERAVWNEDQKHTGSVTSKTLQPVHAPKGEGVKVWVPSCRHDGLEPCLTLKDGRLLYGAQGHALKQRDHLDLIIDCAGAVDGGPDKPFVRARSPRYRSLNLCARVEIVRLDWPDMTAPVQVGIRFWTRLLEMLPQRTCVCCVGSHGRTGTALASLLVAEGMDPDLAIARVREKHCKKAVENPAQESYIRGLKK